jgi:glycosyltransferase involved in cell wall biosynthesis
LTRNRRQWLPQAIQCFQAQTYPLRELLILADGADVRDLVPSDGRIRLVVLSGAAEIGMKRNVGCELAAGDVIAHWDDDDCSAPGRLSDQIGRMEETGVAVTGYHSMRFTDGVRWWLYEGSPNYALGTSLCYRREWWAAHKFKSVQVGEDNQFVAEANHARQLSSVDARDLMYATIHNANTSPRNMAGFRQL